MARDGREVVHWVVWDDTAMPGKEAYVLCHDCIDRYVGDGDVEAKGMGASYDIIPPECDNCGNEVTA